MTHCVSTAVDLLIIQLSTKLDSKQNIQKLKLNMQPQLSLFLFLSIQISCTFTQSICYTEKVVSKVRGTLKKDEVIK